MTALAVRMHVLAAQPQALDVNPRCRKCGKLLARFLARPYLVDCPRCGQTNESVPVLMKKILDM